MGEAIVDLEAQDMKKRISHEENFLEANRPVTLKFEDVGYKVKLEKGTKSKPSKKSEEKIILKGITGIVRPGEMLAMLGPSGSGKSTLLTALGGRLITGKLSGYITYNNELFSSKIKRNTGFVTQDDVLYPTLTVTETLVYTSLLRLPNTFTNAEKISHAETIISQLGLSMCKNSIIGGPFLRGVSGGERKRVSIGQEMLINPSLILLDEPTSGLDSTTAQRIVSTLSELAKGGRTIVMTIHQPSSRLFYMFHKVLLLSEGNPLYFGKGAEICMEYFSKIGYAPTVVMNPSDFLLDLANGIAPDDSRVDQSKVKEDLVVAYKSNLYESLKGSLLQESKTNMAQQGLLIEGKEFAKWSTTWWQQFTVLFRRGVKERKHETFSGLKIGQVLVVAFLSGLLWWQSGISHLQDQMGLLFFSSGFWGFFPLFNAIFTFPQERMMLEKERSSGTYRLSSYFMARTMADSPMELVLPTIFTIITYWMGGLKPNASNFFQTLFVILYSVIVSQGLGLAIGAMVMDQNSATILGSVIMLSFLLVGGYYVQHVPKFISWIKYVSVNQYTYKLLLGSQYKESDTYTCDGNRTCLVGDFPAIQLVGLGDKAISIIAMGLMLIGYRVIAYIALMRIGVTKKKGDEAGALLLIWKNFVLLFK